MGRWVWVACIVALILSACASRQPTLPARPNILLVVFEDLSPRIRALGDPVATTPVLDAFAAEAMQFTAAFTTAGVCAPSRSALITGVHQQTLGTGHMRTRSPVPGLTGGGPIEYDAVPPPAVRAFPELLRAAGYYTSNNGKTDYQFGEPFLIWDDARAPHPWRERDPQQPFFAMVNIMTTHESYLWPTDGASDSPLATLVRQRNLRDLAGKQPVTDPATVPVPPYLPDTPAVRADIARQYDNQHFSERQLARLLAELEEDGLDRNTIVVVTTDHGDGLPRMKRSLYDSGLHVPLLVRFPDGRGAGRRSDALVSFVDLAPTLLSLAGVPVPGYVQGQVAFGPRTAPERRYIYAAMDRHDALPDRQRAVRDRRYKYILNHQPERPFFRRLAFREQLPTMQEIWQAAAAGTAPDSLRRLLEAPRPAEELYDTRRDPDEVRNLAADPAHRKTLERLRAAQLAFLARVGDRAAVPEAEMIAAMWPGLQQPRTAAPKLRVADGQVVLSCATAGAAIGYRIGGTRRWQVYTAPFAVPSGALLEARAQRYGYAVSEQAVLEVP
jgi:arylsulfatase A-like enzyme